MNNYKIQMVQETLYNDSNYYTAVPLNPKRVTRYLLQKQELQKRPIYKTGYFCSNKISHYETIPYWATIAKFDKEKDAKDFLKELVTFKPEVVI